MKINDLDSVCIIGLGLLGGSLGLSLNRALPRLRRIGYSHRETTRAKALEAGAVDEITGAIATAVAHADLVILASPIGAFEALLAEMAPHLRPGALVTDVGSTKVQVHRWARQLLPRNVAFVGSHPMAGSEQRGVEFARADLFEGAACIVTTTRRNPAPAADTLAQLWRTLGMRVSRMTPAAHDRTLARISHLPHVLAAALVNISDDDEMLLCGKGFLDTTRIASGPASVWRDILVTNAAHTDAALGKLIEELTRWRQALARGDGRRLTALLDRARDKRNRLVERKLQRKELPD